eukprot:CAMPEP_0171722052 /NCGR_PEP_ID=MMETSP0991-20121206/22770_1 /TAXON_ID=483369 /ORGANISM="non described non described, Strain CCMP2098" /LENGTH=464 /DNA_ID=CAMNT_0012314129 /DNA_START=75 /DNA_END=1470 /DNA_ORIENTATION=+
MNTNAYKLLVLGVLSVLHVDGCNPLPSEILVGKAGLSKRVKVACFDQGGENNIYDDQGKKRRLALVKVKKPRKPRPIKVNLPEVRSTFNLTNCAEELTTKLTLYHKEELPTRVFTGCYPLTPRAFQRSLVQADNARLLRVVRAASQGQQIVVVVIGGSVACATTEKGKCVVETSSSFLFVQWLKYHGVQIAYHNLALGGTTSLWFLAHIEGLLSLRPDLVIYDYTTNDLDEISSETSISKLKSITESVARAVLSLPSKPALLHFSIFRSPAFQDGRSSSRAEVLAFEPVARAYNYTLVSYGRAVWPNTDKMPDTKSGVFNFDRIHPASYLQQLIADLFAYAWTVAEEKLLATPFISVEVIPLRSPQFQDATITALGSCTKRPGSSFEHDRESNSSLFYAPQRPLSSRWKYLNNTGKSGWQFDHNVVSGASKNSSSHDATLGNVCDFSSNIVLKSTNISVDSKKV